MRPRNLPLEREITQQAAKGYTDPDRLIVHAETRAARLSGEYVPNANLVRLDRDRPRDVREELADARNHLCWHIEDHLDDERVPRWMHALTLICIAYEDLKPDD